MSNFLFVFCMEKRIYQSCIQFDMTLIGHCSKIANINLYYTCRGNLKIKLYLLNKFHKRINKTQINM
jgi:hypothetical protein